ncbi:hypothetical protein SM124_18805 [Bacillus sp. 31A1R]|uniref:Uncharacterized protein n=1 Tax=Robertmurraya mangrovi TaxID=3098077 RepID=A0ABU5J2X1_9BACI|nr:hypothetical protein [Bacillus sp. 31A1R]MDZ5473772.1 hypothetical protein [Bacillus sp. 31A1R]
MNTLNQLLSFLSGRNGQQLIKAITKGRRSRNKNWMLFLGLGTALAFLAGRNKTGMKKDDRRSESSQVLNTNKNTNLTMPQLRLVNEFAQEFLENNKPKQ